MNAPFLLIIDEQETLLEVLTCSTYTGKSEGYDLSLHFRLPPSYQWMDTRPDSRSEKNALHDAFEMRAWLVRRIKGAFSFLLFCSREVRKM